MTNLSNQWAKKRKPALIVEVSPTKKGCQNRNCKEKRVVNFNSHTLSKRLFQELVIEEGKKRLQILKSTRKPTRLNAIGITLKINRQERMTSECVS